MKYKTYVADSLQGIPQHKYISRRYIDMINLDNKPVDDRTGDEIAEDIISKAGLQFVNKEEET